MNDPAHLDSDKRRPDWAALCIALLLAVIAAVIAMDMTRLPNAARYARIGPATIPYAIAIGLAVLSVATAIAAFFGKFPQRERQDLGPVGWIVAGLLTQIALLNLVGFSVATGILFAFTAKGLGRGPLWLSIPIGIALSFAVWFVFAKLLQLNLPAGPRARLLTPGRF